MIVEQIWSVIGYNGYFYNKLIKEMNLRDSPRLKDYTNWDFNMKLLLKWHF